MAKIVHKKIWADIIEYIGYYQVSNSGKVKSLKRTCKKGDGFRTVNSKILKSFINTAGYPSVILQKEGIAKTVTIHRIVAKYFVDGFSDEKDVNHKDHDKTNNWFWNLECVTELENVCHYHSGNKLPINVSKVGNRFRARITVNGKRNHIGLFATKGQASTAYQNALKKNSLTNKYSK